MKMKYLFLTVFCVCFSSIVTAKTSGYYLATQLGITKIKSKEVNINGYSTVYPDYDVSFIDDQTKNLFVAGLSIGYDLDVNHNIPIRTEINYIYRPTAKINSPTYYFLSKPGATGNHTYNSRFKIKQSTLTFNGYYDFYNNSNFIPYLGVGLGTSFVEYKERNGEFSFSENNFVWSLMIGTSYELNDNLTTNIEYRYVDSGKVNKTINTGDWVSKFSAKLHSDNITIGLRYTF